MLRYGVIAVTLCATLVAAPHEPASTVPATTTVVGELSTADEIVVLVPGVGTTPQNLDRTTGAMARSLYAAAQSRRPAAHVAVVAWLGYRPPEGLGIASAQDGRARAGVAPLDRYVDALVAQRPAAAVTLVGHSYGALVIGFAAASLPPQVTDIVALGAPGMGADRVADLHTGAQVWAAQAPDDWIRWVPSIRILHLGHGVHPSSPDFGAHILPTGGVTGHDGYLSPGSATLTAVAGLITADPR
jgi:pimeloyl-ACP methyl ester carboxylesterase